MKDGSILDTDGTRYNVFMKNIPKIVKMIWDLKFKEDRGDLKMSEEENTAAEEVPQGNTAAETNPAPAEEPKTKAKEETQTEEAQETTEETKETTEETKEPETKEAAKEEEKTE